MTTDTAASQAALLVLETMLAQDPLRDIWEREARQEMDLAARRAAAQEAVTLTAAAHAAALEDQAAIQQRLEGVTWQPGPLISGEPSWVALDTLRTELATLQQHLLAAESGLAGAPAGSGQRRKLRRERRDLAEDISDLAEQIAQIEPQAIADMCMARVRNTSRALDAAQAQVASLDAADERPFATGMGKATRAYRHYLRQTGRMWDHLDASERHTPEGMAARAELWDLLASTGTGREVQRDGVNAYKRSVGSGGKVEFLPDGTPVQFSRGASAQQISALPGPAQIDTRPGPVIAEELNARLSDTVGLPATSGPGLFTRGSPR
jgi:hypothetical protein